MNKEKLKKANKISDAINALCELNSVMSAPYPKFEGADKMYVNSAEFDKETLTQLKNVMKSFIKTRVDELQNEFNQL